MRTWSSQSHTMVLYLTMYYESGTEILGQIYFGFNPPNL